MCVVEIERGRGNTMGNRIRGGKGEVLYCIEILMLQKDRERETEGVRCLKIEESNWNREREI